MASLLENCANIHRHFIDTFSFMQPFLGAMLAELRDSISLATNTTELRLRGILNPLFQPSEAPLVLEILEIPKVYKLVSYFDKIIHVINAIKYT